MLAKISLIQVYLFEKGKSIQKGNRKSICNIYLASLHHHRHHLDESLLHHSLVVTWPSETPSYQGLGSMTTDIFYRYNKSSWIMYYNIPCKSSLPSSWWKLTTSFSCSNLTQCNIWLSGSSINGHWRFLPIQQVLMNNALRVLTWSRHMPASFQVTCSSGLLNMPAYIPINVYWLIAAYLLWRVHVDKIMYARWDFNASSALDKHQKWSASLLFCLNSRAQSHTRHRRTC